MGEKNRFGTIAPMEQKIKGLERDDELEKYVHFLNDLLNKKKQEIKAGNLEEYPDFDSLRIKLADIPKSISPNDSRNDIVLGNEINFANSELEVLWKEHLKKAKEERKPEPQQQDVAINPSPESEKTSTQEEKEEKIAIKIKKDITQTVNNRKIILEKRQKINQGDGGNKKGFIARIKAKILGEGKLEEPGEDLRAMKKVLVAEDPREKARQAREAAREMARLTEEAKKIEEAAEAEKLEKKKAEIVLDSSVKSSLSPSPFADDIKAEEEKGGGVIQAEQIPAVENPVPEKVVTPEKNEPAKEVESSNFEGKVFDAVNHIFAEEQLVNLNKEDEILLGLARKSYINKVRNLLVKEFVKEKKDVEMKDDEMEKMVRDFYVGNTERANRDGRAKNKKAIFEVIKKIASGGELKNQEQEKSGDKPIENDEKPKKKKKQKKETVVETGKPVLVGSLEGEPKDQGKIKTEPEKPKDKPEDDLAKKEEGLIDIGGIKIRPDNPDNNKNEDGDEKERESKFADLIRKIENDRRDYLEMEYKKKKAFNSVYKFFGNVFGREKRHNSEEDSDVAYMRAHYDNSLLEYKNALLDDAKKNGDSELKLAEISTVFNMEAKLSLSMAHNDVKAEHLDGRIGQWFVDGTKWYRELPFSKKLLVGAGFAGFMAGGAYIGGTAAVAVGVGAFVKRIFAGTASGVGISLTLEKITEKMREGEVNKEKKEAIEKMKEMSPQERFEFLEAQINKTIYDENNEIDKIKNEKIRNLGIGITTGTLIGSVAVWDDLKSGFGWVSDYVKEIFEVDRVDGVVSGSGDSELAKTLINGHKLDEFEMDVKENLDVTKPEILKVEKGDSLEKTLIKYVTDHKSEIYNHHPELKSFDAGQIAHRMALDFAHEHSDKFPSGPPSLIHPGAEVVFNPETMEIEDIRGDSEIGYLSEKLANESGGVEIEGIEAAEQNPTAAAEVSGSDEVNSESQYPNFETIIADDVRTEGPGVDTSILDAVNDYRDKEHSYFISKMSEDDGFLNQFRKKISSLRKDMCEKNLDIFNQIRNLNFSKNQESILSALPEKGRKIAGEFLKQVPFEKYETFDQWARRLIRISMEK